MWLSDMRPLCLLPPSLLCPLSSSLSCLISCGRAWKMLAVYSQLNPKPDPVPHLIPCRARAELFAWKLSLPVGKNDGKRRISALRLWPEWSLVKTCICLSVIYLSTIYPCIYYLCVCHLLSLISLYLSYLSIHLSVHPLIHLSIPLSIRHLSVYSVYLSVHPSVHPSRHPDIQTSSHPSYLCICVSIYPTCLSIHPSL